jgi:oligopeptide transport system ATP-binding protein
MGEEQNTMQNQSTACPQPAEGAQTQTAENSTPAPEREVLVDVKNLHIAYGSGKKRYVAVNNANFQIYKSETFGLVGESGSGKTTIGRAIMRIIPTSGGEILYDGQKINGHISHVLDRRVIQEIQMIFQDPQSSLNERAKVSYIVGEGLMNVCKGLSAEQRDEKIKQALLDVGLLPEFASRFPHEFSGGQRQRIGIARALIVEPKFIIADEPISALDMSIRAQVLNLLRQLQKDRGITYMFIAHDLSVMRYISDRIAVIHKGDIVELADAEELVTHAIHPYTRALLSAIPMPDPKRERTKTLLTYDPDMHHYEQEPPTWQELRPKHFVLCNKTEAEAWLK